MRIGSLFQLSLKHLLIIDLLIKSHAKQGDIQMTISTNNTLGEQCTLQCIAFPVAGASPRKLQIQDATGRAYLAWSSGKQPVIFSDKAKKRFSGYLTSFNNRTVQAILVINHLECTDDRRYFCQVIWTDANSTDVKETAFRELKLKVPPQSPKIIDTRPSYEASTGIVHEFAFLEFTCISVIGNRGEGSLKWKTESYGLTISMPINVSQKAGQPAGYGVIAPCQEARTTTLRVRVTRKHQNFVAACYVENPQFPMAINACDNFDNQLCSRSKLFFVHYGPHCNDTFVNATPFPTLLEGNPVTLNCHADSYPQPMYTWTKDGDPAWYAKAEIHNEISKLHFSPSKLENTGVYICNATATYENITRTCIKSIKLTIRHRKWINTIADQTNFLLHSSIYIGVILLFASGNILIFYLWRRRTGLSC